jgi:hypothetical protein
MISGLTMDTSVSDFLRFLEVEAATRGLLFAAVTELDASAGCCGLSSGGLGGGGESEGIDESGDMEVMSTEGDRSRRVEL